MNANNWSDLFDKENQPTTGQIADFVITPLWGDLSDYLQLTYKTQPKIEYSGCAMEGGVWKGWNAKYKKSGKSLCTLYPKRGYFLLLVTISKKDIAEADLLVPFFCDYVRDLYNSTELGKNYGKMLGIKVTSEEILRDIKRLIAKTMQNCVSFTAT